jgi:hypothetical protein
MPVQTPTRYYVVAVNQTFEVWEAADQEILDRIKNKPECRLLSPAYETRAEAEAERDRFLNDKPEPTGGCAV